MPNTFLIREPQTSGIAPGLDKDSLSLTAGVYRLHFAESLRDLEAAYRLRFLVFNLELGEGLETAYEHGIIGGYSDNTFRPGNEVSRGQLCKIIVLAEQWPINTQGGPHFTDVPVGSTFYTFIETAYYHAIISGYTCGPSCLEFRPGNNATRGQICKIVYLAVTSIMETSIHQRQPLP